MEQTPIHKVGEFLLVSIQVDMHDRQALILQNDLTTQVVNTRAKGLLIDISTVDIVDSFIGRMLGNMASITRVLGANVVVVGMQPAVAITIVELGLSLSTIQTALNVDKGMALLKTLINKSTNEGRHEPFEK